MSSNIRRMPEPLLGAGGGPPGAGALVTSGGVPVPAKVLVFKGVAVADVPLNAFTFSGVAVAEVLGAASMSPTTSTIASEIDPGFAPGAVSGDLSATGTAGRGEPPAKVFRRCVGERFASGEAPGAALGSLGLGLARSLGGGGRPSGTPDPDRCWFGGAGSPCGGGGAEWIEKNLGSGAGMRPPHSTQKAAPSSPSAPQWGHRAERPAMLTAVPSINVPAAGSRKSE
jgi:hypothetical protein